MGARALLTIGAALVAAAGAGREAAPERAPPADPARPRPGRAGSAPGADPTGRAAAPPEVRWRAGPGLESLARALAGDSALFAPLPGIGDPAAILEDTITIYLVRDLDSLSAPGSVVREEWVAGFADSDRGIIGVRAAEAEGGIGAIRSVLRHELAHLALARATGGRAPRWLHEGYAQLVSGSWDAGEAWRLRMYFLRTGGGTLDRLTVSFPRREQPARTAYLLSYTAVQELYRRGGAPGLRRFFERLDRGATVDAALREVYGVTLAQFEDQWRETVSDRYGWLYLVSRATFFWTAIAVAVLVIWWIRRRRDRQRMEELRREERQEAIRRLLDADGGADGPDPGRAPGLWDPPGSPDDWRSG